MRKSRPGVVRFHSGLRVSARNTQSGPVLGTGGELGGSTGTTSPGTDFGAGGELGALLRVAMGNSPATNHVFPTARSYPDQHDVAEPLPYIGTLHHG
ncbi:TPA: hypothetical protein L5659_006099 [Pseudomonas aeruginosa]|nr:hypothetical protein F3G62_25620 [Pseudomonas aeruginosa]MCO2373617.1 hypothetical protein [Pseudomonas aeruginosa]OPD86648.1 hypothetical protein AO957_30350 [Pseudomonas aeruginosa]ORE36645.1 hypothetical protein BKN47_14200 [Pseudomonas aeruginosa]RPN65231.1 hypothetical protein IPC1237_32525 [Pseudomonas aeruginosa]